jgi:DNA-binding MarR family transcriptional regulator
MTEEDQSAPPASDTPADPLDSHHWRPVHRLLSALDHDIAAVYADAGLSGMKTRYVGPLIQLARREFLSITQLAAAAEVTHSAMSQTVAAMRRAGLVEVVDDAADGRTRRVRLSEGGREITPLFLAEWRATEASLIELEAELPYPLTRVVADIAAALERRPFRQRLADHLDALAGEDT